jgi:hypothetical protein
MTKTTATYTDVLKHKQELEAALAKVTVELETLEHQVEAEKITVEGTGNGVLLGFKTNRNERQELFLTSEEVSELIYNLVTNTPDVQVVVNPFKREWDSLLKQFFPE